MHTTAHVAGKKKKVSSAYLWVVKYWPLCMLGLLCMTQYSLVQLRLFHTTSLSFFLFPFRCNKLCYKEVINEHGWTFRKYSVVLSQRGTMSMTLTRWWRNAVKHHILICITLRTKILTKKLKWNAKHKANLTDCIITSGSSDGPISSALWDHLEQTTTTTASRT